MVASEERTKNYQNGTLNVCICYNSKHEIFDAMESLAQKHASGQVKEISEQTFDAELYGGSNVKPDILIRTSDEIRLSNFMLY
mgnify:CR=1 FL=1